MARARGGDFFRESLTGRDLVLKGPGEGDQAGGIGERAGWRQLGNEFWQGRIEAPSAYDGRYSIRTAFNIDERERRGPA